MHSGDDDNRNLPVDFAGGGFRHDRRLAFDPREQLPSLSSAC
jgi:hypothetical protein